MGKVKNANYQILNIRYKIDYSILILNIKILKEKIGKLKTLN